MDLNGQLRLHERCNVRAVRVGREALPVLVVDDFLSSPQVLVEYAAQATFDAVTDASYPGRRAPLPGIYCFALRAFLGGFIEQAFGLPAARVVRELSHFSLVTTPPGELTPVQRMPHFDNPDPGQLAVLHYLCDSAHGGTSFYRHRSTGFEFIDASRTSVYSKAITQELAATGPPPPRYIRGDDAQFERTASFDCVFNRVLVYRSIDLHSADIGPDCRFDGDPRSGRLTANTFFFYR